MHFILNPFTLTFVSRFSKHLVPKGRVLKVFSDLMPHQEKRKKKKNTSFLGQEEGRPWERGWENKKLFAILEGNE